MLFFVLLCGSAGTRRLLMFNCCAQLTPPMGWKAYMNALARVTGYGFVLTRRLSRDVCELNKTVLSYHAF